MQVWSIFACRINSRHHHTAGNRIHPEDTRYRPLERAAPGNRLHRSAQARYRHDAWGNVVQIDHTAGPHKGRQVRLAYDGEHRLLASERIQTDTDGQRHSVLTCYHYDPMSRRMGKQHLKIVKGNESQSSPSKTSLQIQSSLWFGWDGDRMVTMQNERQASTTIYEPNSFVPMIRVDRQLQADERRAKGESRTYHIHCNYLGTPEALIETDSLQLVWQIELDPWGQTQREYNPNNMLQPIRMQGQQLDAETGLFYNRYRYYDPASGRYVTQDPIGLAGGVNFYGYVGGEPLFYVDPLGLSPFDWAQKAYDWFDKAKTAKETKEKVDTVKSIKNDLKKSRELKEKVLTCTAAQPAVPPGCESIEKLEKDLSEAQELNKKAIKNTARTAVDIYENTPGTLGSGGRPVFIPKP